MKTAFLLFFIATAGAAYVADTSERATYIDWCHTEAATDAELCECEQAGAFPKKPDPGQVYGGDFPGCGVWED